MDTAEKIEAVTAASKEAIVVRAHEKLNRKFADVEVPRNSSTLSSLEKILEQAQGVSANADIIKDTEQQIEALRKDVISATLLPLRTNDIIMVQGVVTEVALQGEKMGFDFDVRLFSMMKAERTATVYLALRKRTNHQERYFATQEEVALMDDATLQVLAKAYADNYILTDEERKNS